MVLSTSTCKGTESETLTQEMVLADIESIKDDLFTSIAGSFFTAIPNPADSALQKWAR
jgi:hypothetical protein